MRLVGSCTTLPGASLPGQRKIPGTLIPPSHPPIAFPPMWETLWKDSYGWPETRVLFFPSPAHPLRTQPTSIDAVPAPLLAYSGIRVLEVSTVVRREVHQSVVGETERVHRLCHFPWDQRNWWELDLNVGHCYNVKASVRPGSLRTHYKIRPGPGAVPTLNVLMRNKLLLLHLPANSQAESAHQSSSPPLQCCRRRDREDFCRWRRDFWRAACGCEPLKRRGGTDDPRSCHRKGKDRERQMCSFQLMSQVRWNLCSHWQSFTRFVFSLKCFDSFISRNVDDVVFCLLDTSSVPFSTKTINLLVHLPNSHRMWRLE